MGCFYIVLRECYKHNYKSPRLFKVGENDFHESPHSFLNKISISYKCPFWYGRLTRMSSFKYNITVGLMTGGLILYRQYPMVYSPYPYNTNYYSPYYQVYSTYGGDRCFQRCMYQTGGNYQLCDTLCYEEFPV